MQELAEKEAMKGCGYCIEKESKLEKYEDDLEKEKTRECLKALEREKIAKGMQCTKGDEILLREMQKEQMREKKMIERSQADVDMMWHQVLLEEVRIKEEQERLRAEILKQEMLERRMAYDEQISSANRERRELLRKERELENRRLEQMKNRMEQDYYDAITRKKNQQMKNKSNYIEGYNMKMSRMLNDKQKEKEIDLSNINIAMEELRRERQQKINQMRSLKMEKQIYVDNYLRERKLAQDLERETERITSSWKEGRENEADDVIRNKESTRRINKIKANQEYKDYLQDLKREKETKRYERKEIMAKVKETAHEELRRKFEDSRRELNKQINYRQSLSNQIQDNQIIMKIESKVIAEKQKAFTKKASNFKDAMKDKAKYGTNSENPVHPFMRVMQNHPDTTLPLIKKIH